MTPFSFCMTQIRSDPASPKRTPFFLQRTFPHVKFASASFQFPLLYPIQWRDVRCEPLRLTHCLASSKSVAALPASCRWGLRGPVTLVLHILYYIILYYIILYIQRKINFEQPIHDGRLIRLDSMSTSNLLYDCRCTCVASKNM